MADSYAYRVRTKEGRVLEGKMDAGGEAAVASKLRSQGMTPIQISKESKASMKMELHILPQRVKLKDVAIFSRQFATMINSGLSLLRALNILAEQSENAKLTESIKSIRDDVERGSSLSAAMSKFPKVFNNLFVSMVRAGETGGQLDTVLMKVADTYETEHKLRQKVKSAMTYPIAVLGISVLLMIVLLIFIVPTFADMFKGLGGELPLPTQILVTMSEKAKFIVPLSFLAFVGLVVGYKKARRSNAEFRLRADQLKLKIPVFGELTDKIAVSRFTRMLGLLLRSGVPILQALDIVGDAAGNEVINRACADVRESVRTGEAMAAPLTEHKVFPPMVIQMISVGEDTGALDDMLDKIADFYDQEVESMTESLVSLIEPIMIAFLGGIVGAMVIALYMPMFKIFELIK
ncbi:type II secretion system F family protein [soil metagenome]